jgi:hypothetical protein
VTPKGQRATERAGKANEEEQVCGEGPVYGILLSQEAIKSSAFVEYLKGQLSENANLALKNLPVNFQTQAKILECTQKIKTLKVEKMGNDAPEMVAAINELNEAKQETLARYVCVCVCVCGRLGVPHTDIYYMYVCIMYHRLFSACQHHRDKKKNRMRLFYAQLSLSLSLSHTHTHTHTHT